MTKGLMGILEGAHLVEAPDSETSEPLAMPVAPAPAPAMVMQPATTAVILSPDDEARRKAIEAEVFAVPSSYAVFANVRNALGSSASIEQVLKILAASNPDITRDKIVASIDSHLGILERKSNEMSATIDKAKADNVDGPQQQIVALRADIEAAQTAIAAKAQQITQLEAAAHDSLQKIQNGQARFNAIEAQISAPLLQAKQILSTP